MADTAGVGLYNLNDMDEVQDNQLVAYFCDETNMAEIFQYDANDILDKLDGRDGNTLLDIRRSLLHKIANKFKDFTVEKARKRTRGSKLVLKDIHTLGYCILNNTTYSLGSAYVPKPDTAVTTRKTRRNTAADAPAPGHSTASTSTSASAPVPASETVAAIGPLLAAARELASAPSPTSAPSLASVPSLEYAPSLASAPLLTSVPSLGPAPSLASAPAATPVPEPAPAPASAPSTSPAPELSPTSENVPAPAPSQGPATNMQQIQLKLEKMNTEIVKLKHQQTLLKDVNTQKTVHITILENKIGHLTDRVNILELMQPQVGGNTQALNLPNRPTPGETAATTASVPALVSASTSASVSSSASPLPVAAVLASASSSAPASAPASARASTPASTATSASTATPSPASAPAVVTAAATTPPSPNPAAQPASQDLSTQLPLKCGPQNDHIFIAKVDASYTEGGIKEYVNERTDIDIGAITVLMLHERDGNKAFKVTVPAGKQQQTITSFGTFVTAEPYRFFNRNGNQANRNNFRGSDNFRGPANFRSSANYRGPGNYSGRPNHNGSNNQYRGRSNRPTSHNQQGYNQQRSYQQQRPRGNYYY